MGNRARAHSALGRIAQREPRDVGRIVAAMRKDDMFSFGIRVLRASAATIPVSLSVDRADGVEEGDVERVRSSLVDAWDAHVRDALLAIEYGRSVLEVVLATDPRGLVVVNSMSPIPWEYSRLILDQESGEIDRIEVRARGVSVELEPSEVWIATYQGSASNPHGVSIYRGAPWNVLQLRKTLREQYSAWVGRYSLGFGIVKAPAEPVESGIARKGSAGQIDERGEAIDAMEEVARALEKVKGGGHLILQSGQYPSEVGGGPLYEYVSGPEMRGAAPLENLQRQLDVMALRSLGIPERALIQDGETGSRAVADAHQIVYHDFVDDIVRQIVASYQSQVIDRVVARNWRGRVRMTMTWRPSGDASESRAEEIIRALLSQPQPNPLALRTLDVVGLMESLGFSVLPDARESVEELARTTPASSPLPMGSFSMDEVRSAALERRSRFIAALRSEGLWRNYGSSRAADPGTARNGHPA